MTGTPLDSTSLLIAFTYYGDVDLSRQTNIIDFAICSANHNTAQPWTGGETNHDGMVNIADFALIAANLNADVIGRGVSGIP